MKGQNDFPTTEFVYDQLATAADDTVLETLAWAAIKAIQQRDATREVLKSAMTQLAEFNRTIDKLRDWNRQLRESRSQSRRAA